MNTAARYYRKAIMTAAWEIVRKANVALYGFRVIMSRALKAAWANAKHERAMKAREEQQAKASPEVVRIQSEIAVLESKTHWDQPDYARIGVLRADLRAAQEHDAAAQDCAATEAGKRAVEMRKARHPHLLPVWDAKARAPRSVNLATISRIAVDGVVHEYRA